MSDKGYLHNPNSFDMQRYTQQCRAYGLHAALFANDNREYVIGFTFTIPSEPVCYIRRLAPETDHEVFEIGYITVSSDDEITYIPTETFTNIRERVLKAQNIMREIHADELSADQKFAAFDFVQTPDRLIEWSDKNNLEPKYTILKGRNGGRPQKFVHLIRDGVP